LVLNIWVARQPPNGLRYPLVGGTRERHFDGTNSNHAKCLKTRRVPPVGCTLCWAGATCARLVAWKPEPRPYWIDCTRHKTFDNAH